MDTDENKIKKLNSGAIPIYEPGLEKLVMDNSCTRRLKFTTDIEEAVKKGRVIFITVGTPPMEDGSVNLESVFDTAASVARHISGYKVIVVKSTVPVGTGRLVGKAITERLVHNEPGTGFDMVSNPEFLREGSAVYDFFNPERIVIGAAETKAAEIVRGLYEPICKKRDIPFVMTGIETSEMIKYASNSFLAAKISFINEVANMCELCGADVCDVSLAMGLDSRIGPRFLNPGPGFGGSCFPKDTLAFLNMGKALGYEPLIVRSILKVNSNQRLRMFEKIKKSVGSLDGKVVTMLGVAFKPGTDDIRESPALLIIELLLSENALVRICDPKALDNLRRYYPELQVQYCDDAYAAASGSDCIVLHTEWEEYVNLDFTKLKALVRTPVFIDLRNACQPGLVKGAGFLYQGVGRA